MSIGSPAQKVRGPGLVATGRGLTVTLNVWGVPGQAPRRGVTVMVLTCWDVTLAAVKTKLLLVLPEAAIPVAVLLFTH